MAIFEIAKNEIWPKKFHEIDLFDFTSFFFACVFFSKFEFLIGSTYMAAVGLIPEFKIQDDVEDNGISAVHYMAQLVEFVFGMREKLSNINENSYNTFTLRVGMNVGPVVAGVIGNYI